ncbi:MAG: hypothetical protein Q4G09_03520 [Clostridia bacterium]|nr:hypothetical protein [Clostridia bacterium]
MYTNLMCMEKNDYIKLVNISRHYAHKKLEDCRVFNKTDKTTELYKEKTINGIKCVIFGWNGKSMSAIDADHDLYGIDLQKEKAKNGYILMEFEDRMLVKFENKSIYRELELAMNVDKIIRDDFSLVYNDEEIESKKEEEEEFE